MNMKKLMTIVVAAISIATFASGLYFVSGGDFRECHIKYSIMTEQPNETITITPPRVQVLGSYGNADYANPWSVKTDGQEFTYSKVENINVPTSSLGGSGVLAEPTQYTYANPGNHSVKIYDENGNAYIIYFNAMTNLVSLYIDMSKTKAASKFGKQISGIDVRVYNCPNLKNMTYVLANNEYGKYTNFNATAFSQLRRIDNFTLKNVDGIQLITGSQFSKSAMTNSLHFANVTNIAGSAFERSHRMSGLSIPRIVDIGGMVCNIGSSSLDVALPDATIINNGYGLKKLRIGDRINSIGRNSFWRQLNLTTIEFVTDEEDWIGTWNAKTFLTQFFGVASEIDGKSDEATLTRLPTSEIPNSVYSVSSGLPTPTTLKLIRWAEADNQ